MDPDEALAQIREVLAKPGPDAYADLATLVDGLDGWLSRGGFLPKAWGQRHTVHVTVEPVAEDAVWCEDCQEWVTSGAPEAGHGHG